MKIILSIIFVATMSFTASAQLLLMTGEQKNSLSVKAGWDQIISTGINYSQAINPLFNNHPANLQVEYLSPIISFHKPENGRFSFGLQTELCRVNRLALSAHVFGTYSWTKDVTARIDGIGIYTSVMPSYSTANNWLFGLEVAYRPTLFSHFRFSEMSGDTFRDRYPDTRGNDEITERGGWYSFTNNKYQLAILIKKKITNYQLGLKLGFEHFRNDHKVILNGWIGQIPLNANVNFSYNF